LFPSCESGSMSLTFFSTSKSKSVDSSL
jgi:hypothetical protein